MLVAALKVVHVPLVVAGRLCNLQAQTSEPTKNITVSGLCLASSACCIKAVYTPTTLLQGCPQQAGWSARLVAGSTTMHFLCGAATASGCLRHAALTLLSISSFHRPQLWPLMFSQVWARPVAAPHSQQNDCRETNNRWYVSNPTQVKGSAASRWCLAGEVSAQAVQGLKPAVGCSGLYVLGAPHLHEQAGTLSNSACVANHTAHFSTTSAPPGHTCRSHGCSRRSSPPACGRWGRAWCWL